MSGHSNLGKKQPGDLSPIAAIRVRGMSSLQLFSGTRVSRSWESDGVTDSRTLTLFVLSMTKAKG